MAKKINIRPTTSVYATYKNINYQIWNAIGEFVDNSTQSYFSNKDKLSTSKYWDGLNIEINYQKDSSGDYYLEIVDNAFGMDIHDFERAIVLDSKPNFTNRSEFGMGLKTAACWFGLLWSVESTQLGSDVKYSAEIDVEFLKTYKNEEIEVIEEKSGKNEHYTRITIKKMNRTIWGRQVNTTIKMLSGMYRRDINSGEISIYYNGNALEFTEPEPYVETLEDGTKKVWAKDDIHFEIAHNNVKYSVSGKISIRKVANVKESGFTLLRYGRVIVGGYENNYRPKEIFGDQNSFRFQRLIGEFEMDGWPVVQSKDTFDWYNGLEELFIDKLLEVSKEYMGKAEAIRVRKRINSEEVTSRMLETFSSKGVISDAKFIVNQDLDSIDDNTAKSSTKISQTDKKSSTEDISIDSSDGKILEFHLNNKKTRIIMNEYTGQSVESWLSISSILKESSSTPEYDTYKVEWNINHPFFSDNMRDTKSYEFVQNLVFAFAISEIQTMTSSLDGRVLPSDLRMNMNSILMNFDGGNK